jgi:hypothetical protein
VTRNISLDPIVSRSTSPKLVVFVPNKTVHVSLDPVLRYYFGFGQNVYLSPKS